jgi:hypothetical protein
LPCFEKADMDASLDYLARHIQTGLDQRKAVDSAI